MCLPQSVIEYPEEGFAILRDNGGSYLAFRDSDRFESLSDIPEPTIPNRWRNVSNQERDMDPWQLKFG